MLDWLRGLFIEFNGWFGRGRFVEHGKYKSSYFEYLPEANHSKCDYLTEHSEPYVVLYSYEGCPACKEIAAWMDVEWIPFVEVKCKPIYPMTMVRRRELQGFLLHKCKAKGYKSCKLLLHPEFPQMLLVDKSGETKDVYFNVELMKEEIKEFLIRNEVPGFSKENMMHDNTPEPPQNIEQPSTGGEENEEVSGPTNQVVSQVSSQGASTLTADQIKELVGWDKDKQEKYHGAS